MYFPRVECLEDGGQWSVKITMGEKIEFVNTEPILVTSNKTLAENVADSLNIYIDIIEKDNNYEAVEVHKHWDLNKWYVIRSSDFDTAGLEHCVMVSYNENKARMSRGCIYNYLERYIWPQLQEENTKETAMSNIEELRNQILNEVNSLSLLDDTGTAADRYVEFYVNDKGQVKRATYKKVEDTGGER